MLKLSGAVIVVLLVIVGILVLGHSLTDSASPAVFDGVTPSDLSASGIFILDPNPSDQPAVSRDSATRSVLLQGGITVEASQLIRVILSGGEGSILHSISGEFLAWAIRLDTSGAGVAECLGTSLCFSSSANPTIAFVNAETGDFLRSIGVPAAPTP
jgi:hypothetical protein